jgi:hypothetical protein
VLGKREVTFVYIRGHSADGGNGRADLLVQWGKTDGSYIRILEMDDAEGPRFVAVVTEPPLGVKRKREDELEQEDTSNADEED